MKKRIMRIVGIHDFVSKSGKKCRQVYLVGDPGMLVGVWNGQEACMIWIFEGNDYFDLPGAELIGCSCEVVSIGKEQAIGSILEC